MNNQAQQFSVLAVDDNELTLEVLQELLMIAGYQVFTAPTAQAAKEIAKKECPDLIILDIMLPQESGYKVLEYLKQTPETAAIPVIFITALSDIEAKVKGFELGAIDYITKPYHPSEILARIRNHIKLKHAQSEIMKNQARKLKQLEAAQTAILPKPTELPEAKFAVYYSSLHEAGGDYYDIIQTSQNSFGYFIGDIAGHDIQTSFITAALKPLLRQNCSAIYSIEESMKIINQILIEILPKEKFLTASYLTINRASNKAVFVNMGHLPLLYRPVDGTAIKLEMISDILGVFRDAIFSQKHLNIKTGDRFYLFTDGLIAENATSQDEGARINHILHELNKLEGISLDQEVKALSNTFISRKMPQKDDIILLGIEV